ncbi:DUF3263 domain-containing protein [Streptomyces sp. XM4193]|uniref:DUF3263 domain-containing protein n=1 Tax=Streptomyces sp. XM4193 TaxID=2929782 RepID=UPI001FFBFFAD|nr:DUF3263 domain-containing protein [Streptomyces sp. XM4193]MCK1795306.1 DUF3263 domain-containing protein [Streptomyces sp. XM4193]
MTQPADPADPSAATRAPSLAPSGAAEGGTERDAAAVEGGSEGAEGGADRADRAAYAVPAGEGSAGEGSAGEGSAGEGPAGDGGLDARDRAVLALERRGWPGPGAKERAVREQLGLSPTRYYQLLNALLDDPAAARHDPVTVNRLRRVREAHRARR